MRTLRSEDYWDIGLVVLLITISVITLIGISGVKESPYEPLGPAFLPKTLSYSFFVMSAMILIKVFLRNRKSNEPASLQQQDREDAETNEDTTVLHPLLVIFTIGLSTLFIASLKVIGFRLSSFLFIIILGTVLVNYEKKVNKKTYFISLISIAIVLSIGLYLVFRHILGVRVP